MTIPTHEMPIALLVPFILLFAMMIFDLGLVVFRGTGSSISNAMVTAGFKSPFLVFCCGNVTGHLLFYMQPITCVDRFTTGYQAAYLALLAATGWVGFRLGKHAIAA